MVAPGDRESRSPVGSSETPGVEAQDEGLTEELGLASAADRPGSDESPVPGGPRRWPKVAAAAAAVLVLGGLGALAVRGTGPQPGPPGPGSQSSPAASRLTIPRSSSAYTQDTLARQARTLLAASPAPAAPSDAEALGPLATAAGLDACLAALGEADADAVTEDLATYEGEPAAVLVVTKEGSTTAYAVRPGCSTGDPQILQDSVPVP